MLKDNKDRNYEFTYIIIVDPLRDMLEIEEPPTVIMVGQYIIYNNRSQFK